MVKAMVVLTGAVMIVRMQYRFRSRRSQACAKAVVASVCAVVARAVASVSHRRRLHRQQRSHPRQPLGRRVHLGQSGFRPSPAVLL